MDDEQGFSVAQAANETPPESGTTPNAEAEFNEAFGRMSAAWIRNRPQFPFEELDKYRDHYVAWDPEVTKIIAATETDGEIYRLIKAAGYHPGLCVVEYIF